MCGYSIKTHNISILNYYFLRRKTNITKITKVIFLKKNIKDCLKLKKKIGQALIFSGY